MSPPQQPTAGHGSAIRSWLAAIIICVLAALTAATGARADSNVYGGGDYGTCTYSSCGITISSSGSVALNVTPTASGSCTVASDAVGVLTDNSNGFSLSVQDNNTSAALISGSNTIPASSGTTASPIALAANTWGFRVDGWSGFGAGPTATQSNGGVPGALFAGMPASNQTAATLANTSVAADPTVTTTVWYGLCANTQLPSGTYTTQVTYTATAN